MKVNLTPGSVRQKFEPGDPALQPAPETAQTTGERRSPARQGSRGDKYRISPSVIVNIVQASDLFLLLFCGLLVRIMLAPLHRLPSAGPLFLATATASLVTAVLFSRARVYLLPSLCSLGKQLKLLPMPLLGGGGSMIVCLFLMRDDGLVFRQWPFLWLCSSALLLLASRCYSSRLLHGWSRSGRLARRVAVIVAGEFSREFIERLRAEPALYTVVGLYDDRLSPHPVDTERDERSRQRARSFGTKP